MPGHNKGFCCMVLPRDLFSLSLCYLVIGSLENAEVQPETSESHGFIVLHMFRPITMHFCRHIFNGGKKHMYSSTPYDWCISFFFSFFFFFPFSNLSSCNVSSIWSFPLNFSPPFFNPITPHWNFPESNTKMGGKSNSQQQFNFIFFLPFFFIKRKRMVVVHKNSSVKKKNQSLQSDSDSEWLFQHVSSRAHLDQDREVWFLIQPQTGQGTISSVIFMCTPVPYWPKWATADPSRVNVDDFSLTFRTKGTFHQLSCTLQWSQVRWLRPFIFPGCCDR